MISRFEYHGSSFKLFGVQVEVQFSMNEACSECAVEGHWRLSSVLRSRCFFALKDLALHYKSYILSYIEYSCCECPFRKCRSCAEAILRNINISVFEAFHQLNLGSLFCWRDIANLGIIFRAITKRHPHQLRSLFRVSGSFSLSRPRRPLHRYDVIDATRVLCPDYLDRSTFGCVVVFNLLPECVFHFEDNDAFFVSFTIFSLNFIVLLKFASNHVAEWERIFHVVALLCTMCCAVFLILLTYMFTSSLFVLFSLVGLTFLLFFIDGCGCAGQMKGKSKCKCICLLFCRIDTGGNRISFVRQAIADKGHVEADLHLRLVNWAEIFPRLCNASFCHAFT